MSFFKLASLTQFCPQNRVDTATKLSEIKLDQRTSPFINKKSYKLLSKNNIIVIPGDGQPKHRVAQEASIRKEKIQNFILELKR